MVDNSGGAAGDFSSAATTSARRPVTIDIDADLLDWIEQAGGSVAAEVNGLLRFVMDTTRQREADATPDAWEPGEMEPPAL